MAPRRKINQAIDHSAARVKIEVIDLITLRLQSFGELDEVSFLIQDDWPVEGFWRTPVQRSLSPAPSACCSTASASPSATAAAWLRSDYP